MEIRYGSCRTVVFVGSYVFKFPHFHSLFKSLGHLFQFPLKKTRKSVRYWWQEIFSGAIRQNLTEYKCWKSCEAKFLVPSIFSCGILNIQKLEVGNVPNQSEIEALVIKMADKTDGEIFKIDNHCIGIENFLVNETGYHLVDYGDREKDVESGKLPLTQYLTKWCRELSEIFMPKNQSTIFLI